MQPFRKAKTLFIEGFRYGYQKQRIKSSQRRIEDQQELINRNERLIQRANVFLERSRLEREEMAEKARKDNDPQRKIEWVFYVGDSRPVSVVMNEDMYAALQCNSKWAWETVTTFVDAELERREKEGEA